MNFTKLLKPFDDNLKYLNENKNILLFALALLGIYLVHFNESITNKAIELYSNDIFKLIIFVIITYVSGSSPAIGISLAIIMLISFQIITNKKLKQDLEKNLLEPEKSLEKFNIFSEISPSDTTYLSNEFLTNPLEKVSKYEKSFDFKLITPKDISIQMMNEGKLMLDNSNQMMNDLKTRFDSREQEIAKITMKTGTDLIESGLNRIQQSDMGEYNTNPIKFIKYDNLFDENSNVSNSSDNINWIENIAEYNELINKWKNSLKPTNSTFKSIQSINSLQQDEKNIEKNIKKININQFELLKKFYTNKKNKFPMEKQKIIDKHIELITQHKINGIDFTNELNKLINLI